MDWSKRKKRLLIREVERPPNKNGLAIVKQFYNLKGEVLNETIGDITL